VPGDYPTIQEGINVSIDGDIVLVADGTYYENINFIGKAITVASHFLIDGDTAHISNTIINGSQPSHPDSGSVVSFVNGEDTMSVLCGFTITGGKGTFFSGGFDNSNGGGILCSNAGAKIIYNKINENEVIVGGGFSYAYGGGIFACGNSTEYFIIIENNVVSNNYASNYASGGWGAMGGGIYIKMDGRINKNIICGNKTFDLRLYAGGGITVVDYSPDVCNNIIFDNYSNDQGGGMTIAFSDVVLFNNLIFNNKAEGYGGGIEFLGFTNAILINNTIVNNMANGKGGGINLNNEPLVIMNCIFWGNIATADSQLSCNFSNQPNLFWCTIQGGWSGSGNIDLYPEFVDSANGDFHLAENSPCIGAAIDSIEIAGTWYYCPLTDMEGNPRPNPPGSMPDMGAFESSLSVSSIEDYLSQTPNTYLLEQNFPNPFNSVTKIRYSIPQTSIVVIKVYDILGNEIKTLVKEEKSAGTYELNWNAKDLPSGAYFYRLQAGDFVEAKKMLLIK
jgi:hypothetical protein